jgi:lipopolysaccharide assembly outer membrane protein LptD (OstA)
MKRCSILFGSLLMVVPSLLSATSILNPEEQKQLSRGPLRISADVTESSKGGQLIEAQGHVRVLYDLESGDRLNSISDYARYNQPEGLGEIWGRTEAVWKQKDPAQPETRLAADNVTIHIKDSELVATGSVRVDQTSSTLTAEQIIFYNVEKKMTAEGRRPTFSFRQPKQNIRISAERIVALTDRRQIQFTEKVKGVVEFTQTQ